MLKRFLLLPILMVAHVLVSAQDHCRSADYQAQMLQNNPALVSKMADIENFTQNYLSALQHKTDGINLSSNVPTVINIPVVVHVLYNTAQENISDAQILSQIDILNQDFQRLNADTINTPQVFQPVAANCGFQFALAKVDTAGYTTTGIVRKHTTVQQFGLQDQIKFSAQGGDDAWDRNSYLNIWVGNLSGGILGYTSVVGGPAANDGVVVLYAAFGMGGTATAPFNKGRTTTHEVGHWLNLIHTWGDADCGDDHVTDTPPQSAADYGCPSGTIISCNNAPYGNMYSNFMDFTNDACMNLFTNGQRCRMQSLFQPGGARYPLLSSTALTATPLPLPVNKQIENVNIVSLYPNPAHDMISLQINEQILAGSSLEIYNQVGQKMMSTIISQQTFQLNISTLSQGIYYIKINDGQNRTMSKLLKL
ncbi:MAG: T9SS type A sorting domain-containing protein [Bacteroidetes bacterium]|nr:T9SS type A sorting domain-containing protein [Bacteroidota bacterium]